MRVFIQTYRRHIPESAASLSPHSSNRVFHVGTGHFGRYEMTLRPPVESNWSRLLLLLSLNQLFSSVGPVCKSFEWKFSCRNIKWVLQKSNSLSGSDSPSSWFLLSHRRRWNLLPLCCWCTFHSCRSFVSTSHENVRCRGHDCKKTFLD